MTNLNYDDAPFAIRDDLTMAHCGAWEKLSAPVTRLTADTRVAIIAEVRNVIGCAFCQQRKGALSPDSVAGEHDNLGDLAENIVEVIHRLKPTADFWELLGITAFPSGRSEGGS